MKRIIAALAALALSVPLAGCSDAADAYSAALATHASEVEAYEVAKAKAETYAPSCRDFAGNQECSALEGALAEAQEAGLRTELKEVDSPEETDVQAVKRETEKVAAARGKLESATGKVAASIEGRLSAAFPALIEESRAKVEAALERADGLGEEVADPATLGALREAAAALRAGCDRWQGAATPTGSEGMAAYSELSRLKGALDGALSAADNSHSDWQAEESRRIQDEAKKKAEEDERARLESLREVTLGDGKVRLAGTVEAVNSCEDPARNDFAYLLLLDQPMTFTAEAPWPDGQTEKTVDKIAIASKAQEGDVCGAFSPWDSLVGQHVTIQGALTTDPEARHADIVFADPAHVTE